VISWLFMLSEREINTNLQLCRRVLMGWSFNRLGGLIIPTGFGGSAILTQWCRDRVLLPARNQASLKPSTKFKGY
jgi:hypothetical protein